MPNRENTVPIPAETGSRTALLLDRVVTYIHSNLTARITLKEIAANCGVSISTVTQLFQKKLGITFHQYLTRCRMEAARQLMYTSTPLEEIGRQVGYTDHSTFYRAFRQTFGMSPREYRRNIERKRAEEQQEAL